MFPRRRTGILQNQNDHSAKLTSPTIARMPTNPGLAVGEMAAERAPLAPALPLGFTLPVEVPMEVPTEVAVAASVDATVEVLEELVALEARARAWKALKLLGPSATALTAKTIPAGQWFVCWQYTQMGAVCSMS